MKVSEIKLKIRRRRWFFRQCAAELRNPLPKEVTDDEGRVHGGIGQIHTREMQ